MNPIRNLLQAFSQWRERPRPMTPDELVTLLRRMQADEATHAEWDYFQSVALADPRLEPIRDQVAAVYGPGFDPAGDPVLAAAIAQAEQVAALAHNDPSAEPDADDLWQYRKTAEIYRFGLALRDLHRTNPWPDVPLLPHAINHLMTELWDHGFSQTEIRDAFHDAIADMPRYAAGDEVRP